MEVTEHENDPESYVLETLHQAAFRNALSNSLYTPKFNIGCITANTLKSYMDSWFLGRRITLVGIGVDHAELVSMAQSSLSSAREGLSTDEETSHYYGGGEVLSPTQASLTHSAIVSKGASLGSQDVLLAGVLQHLMGVGVSVKWGGSPSRLQKAGSEATDAPFNACTVNLNYSDNGLFGFFVTSEPQDTEKLLRAVMQNFNSVAKGDISDADLTRAKNQLKASYLMPVEQSPSLSDDIAAQVSLNGEYTPLTATNQKVDAITNDELIQFAKGVFGTRSTFVARGNLSSTPRMQQLLEGVSLR
jgi:ubiquinol-cytochrome c reductase core subunit 2